MRSAIDQRNCGFGPKNSAEPEATFARQMLEAQKEDREEVEVATVSEKYLNQEKNVLFACVRGISAKMII